MKPLRAFRAEFPVSRTHVSPHLYNILSEMERVADAVRALLLRRRSA